MFLLVTRSFSYDRFELFNVPLLSYINEAVAGVFFLVCFQFRHFLILATVYAEENLSVGHNSPCLLVSLKQSTSYVLPIVNRRYVNDVTTLVNLEALVFCNAIFPVSV